MAFLVIFRVFGDCKKKKKKEGRKKRIIKEEGVMYTRTKRVRVCVCVCVSSLPTNRRSCWAAHLNGRGAPTGDEPDSLFLFIYPVHFFKIRKKKRKPVELELELFPHFLLSRLFDYHRNPFPVGIYIPSKKQTFIKQFRDSGI
jgi:hypothetical protein